MKEVLRAINQYYDNDKFSEVINLWNNNSNLIDTELLGESERFELYETLADCYNRVGDYKQSLIFADKQIYFLMKNRNDENFEKNIVFYYLLKFDIYQNIGNKLKQYKLLEEYIEIGGKNNKLVEMKDLIELYFTQKIKKVNSIFSYVYVGLVLLFFYLDFVSGLELYESIITMVIVFIGLFWIGYFMFFPIQNRKFIMKILSKLSSVL